MSEASSEQISEAPVPGIKRGRGRPPGSRNKVGKSAKELLDLNGKGAIETLCRIAAGHVVYGPPDDRGERQRLEPTLAERLQAARIVADKLVPSLKASETVSDVTTRTENDVSISDLASALLSVINRGVDVNDALAALPIQATMSPAVSGR